MLWSHFHAIYLSSYLYLSSVYLSISLLSVYPSLKACPTLTPMMVLYLTVKEEQNTVFQPLFHLPAFSLFSLRRKDDRSTAGKRRCLGDPEEMLSQALGKGLIPHLDSLNEP